jgi:hypothetical protein
MYWIRKATCILQADVCLGKLKLKLNYDLQSVGQFVLVSCSYLEPMTRFLFSAWHLQVSCCGAPSLMRGWVCNLLVQLLVGLARAVTLEPKSCRTQTIFYCLIWDSPQPGGSCPHIYIPQEQGGPVIPSLLGTGFPFHCRLWLTGLRWSYSNPHPLGFWKLKFKLYCDRRSVCHFILVSGPHLWPTTRFVLLPDIWSLHVVGTIGWVYNLFVQFAVTLGPKSQRTHDHVLQSHLRLPQPGLRFRFRLFCDRRLVGQSVLVLGPWPHLTVSSETPRTFRGRSLYLYPPGTGWPSYTPRHRVSFLSPLTTRRAMVEVF